MLLSQSPIRTFMVLFTAILTTSVLFTASAGHARSSAVVYTAELVAPVEAAQHIIKGTVIRCAGTACKGAKSGSSIRTVCAKLAQKVGPLESFAYKGKVLDADALAKCNK